MRAPYKYLFKLWLLTVLLGPVFVALYQFKMESLGVMFVLWGFGLFFSLPAVLVGLVVVAVAQQQRMPARRFRIVLAVVGSVVIAVTLSLVQGAFAWEMTIPYVLAVAVATWLLGRNAKDEEVPPVGGV